MFAEENMNLGSQLAYWVSLLYLLVGHVTRLNMRWKKTMEMTSNGMLIYFAVE